jgi:hypothetical protein
MHRAIEVLEEYGIVSERHLAEIDDFDKKKIVRLYEHLYSAVRDTQAIIPQLEEETIDPFTFIASASMRAESTCWEWLCRIQKLDFLGRYAALYANTVTVPLPLREPSRITNVDWAKSLISHSGLTLLSLRPLVDQGYVVPAVMVTQHCEHTGPWVDEMIRLTHEVADDAAKKMTARFHASYQLPEKSPTGRSTIYVRGPEDFVEHGSLVELFDEGKNWRPRSWKFNRVGKHELSGPKKTDVVRRILHQIATDTTFYLAFGRTHNARYLTDRRGEAFLLELLTEDDEIEANNAALNAYMKHSLPLLGDLSLATLLRIRKEERDSFVRYRSALQRLLDNAAKQNHRIGKAEVQEIFKQQIEPQLLKMKSELHQEQRRQRKRIVGGLATLGASVGLGAFGGVVPLLAKAAAVAATAMVGGRLLSKAAEAKCEHGATLKEKNDFYFLLRLTQESEAS